jgi:hypothetical protein
VDGMDLGEENLEVEVRDQWRRLFHIMICMDLDLIYSAFVTVKVLRFHHFESLNRRM